MSVEKKKKMLYEIARVSLLPKIIGKQDVVLSDSRMTAMETQPGSAIDGQEQ